ncbi:MAG: hypothetical protein IJH52_09795 [Oscillospiraceae bacterium]|nr:hypothetical protein [Oscillospiraceae bacterium]
MKRLFALVLTVVLLCGVMLSVPAAAYGGGAKWVSAWSTSPVDASLSEIGALSGISVPVTNVSSRVVIRTTMSGNQVRLVFSNEHSKFPLVLSACSVARSASGDAEVLPCTLRTVRFRGICFAVIPAGGCVTSDPVDMCVKAGEPLAVTTYYRGLSAMRTIGLIGAKSYAAIGNWTRSRVMFPALPLNFTADSGAYDIIPALKEVDVRTSDPDAGACVVFGDSTVANEIPRMLAARLWDQGITNVSVTQAAIKGDRLSYDGVGKIAGITGHAGIDRFEADVLDQAGVTSVIVKIGVNDVIHPQLNSKKGAAPYASFEQLTADFTALVQMAHARGVKVYFAELTPWKGYTRNLFGVTGDDIVWTPEIDALRVQLNDWMRSDACPADGVVSFPELADPADPAALQAAYTTDGIHFTDAGAQRIANAIPLEWFD